MEEQDISKQYKSFDGCVYFFNYKKSMWQKVCDIEISELPADVKIACQADIDAVPKLLAANALKAEAVEKVL